MNAKKKLWGSILLWGLILLLSLWSWWKPPEELSLTERRKLTQAPEISFQTIRSGRYSKQYEDYLLDQFPLREQLRGWKTRLSKDLLGRSEIHGIIEKDGYAAKLETRLNEESIAHAAERFQYLSEQCFAEAKGIYLSVIPDKSYYMKDSFPVYDQDELVRQLRALCPEMEYIDLFPVLDLEAYYRTDPHWRQEMLLPAAELLCRRMGTETESEYEIQMIEPSFVGLYPGQLASPMASEPIHICKSSQLDRTEVYHYETGETLPVYDLERLKGNDPYEVFLSGPVSLVQMTDPKSESNRELVIVRDSFSGSIAPLLMKGYRSITLVDIRYLPSIRAKELIDGSGKDVLFLYSASVLNNSAVIK